MIEIEVEADDWSAALPEVEAVVERAATAALGTVQGDVVVLLTDDEAVRDSLRALRLLTFEETGSVISAATTSLPVSTSTRCRAASKSGALGLLATAIVTARPRARRAATRPAAESIRLISQPPKMSP